MTETQWRYFIVIGKVQGKIKKVAMRALSKPTVSEAMETFKDILDEVNVVKEATEDIAAYCGI